MPKKPKSWQAGLKGAGPYMGLGIQLAGSMVAYVFAGYLADRWLDTSPWLLLAGSALGMVAFFVQLFRVVKQMDRDKEAGRDA